MRIVSSGLLKKAAALLSVAVMSACASRTQLPTNHTAVEQFNALGSRREKEVAAAFYQLGRGDVVQAQALARRNAYVLPGPVGQVGPMLSKKPADPPLQRRYVELPVPGHTEADGTEIEPSNVVVEVVQ